MKKDLPITTRLENAGIKMIGHYPEQSLKECFLEYDGKKLIRPRASKCEEFCKEHFNVKI